MGVYSLKMVQASLIINFYYCGCLLAQESRLDTHRGLNVYYETVQPRQTNKMMTRVKFVLSGNIFSTSPVISWTTGEDHMAFSGSSRSLSHMSDLVRDFIQDFISRLSSCLILLPLRSHLSGLRNGGCAIRYYFYLIYGLRGNSFIHYRSFQGGYSGGAFSCPSRRFPCADLALCIFIFCKADPCSYDQRDGPSHLLYSLR